MDIPKEKLLEMYRNMVIARLIDEKLMELFSAGKLPMPWLHRRPGEEAIPVAIGAVLNKDDYWEPNQFSFYCVFVKGFSIRDTIASELLRDPAMHGGRHSWWDPEYGMFGFTGSLGETIPIFLGCALSCKLNKRGQVTIDVCGDGQASRGPVHESMIMAKFLNLPIVFGIHNNQYASGQSSKPLYAGMDDISDRAKAYGFPGESVDGNDVIACYEVTKKYVDRARSGGGPALIVYHTYRLRGHSEGGPQIYRPKGEAEEWWKLDPIPRYQKQLIEMGVLTEADIERIQKEVQAEVDKATEEAVAMPELGYEDYMKGIGSVIDQY